MMQYHPDKNTDDPDAEQKFVEISNGKNTCAINLQLAYDVLIDPDKRAKYDQFGESAFDPNAGGGGRVIISNHLLTDCSLTSKEETHSIFLNSNRSIKFSNFCRFFKGFGGADGGFPGGSFSGGLKVNKLI